MAGKRKIPKSDYPEIERRLLAGESASAIAREYGVYESAIRKLFSEKVKTVKAVAVKVLDAENTLNSLDYDTKMSVQNHIAELRETSLHLTHAAKSNAKVARTLANLAAQKSEEITPENVNEMTEEVATIIGLSRGANEAGKLGIELIKANQGIKDEPPQTESNDEITRRLKERHEKRK